MARREVDGGAVCRALHGKTSARCTITQKCELLRVALDMERGSVKSGLQTTILPEGAVGLRGTKTGAPLLFFSYCPFCGFKLQELE